MQDQNEAMLFGTLLTIASMAAVILWWETNGYASTRRRAVRLAIPAGVAFAIAVGLAEWRLYEADPIAGSFMLMPSAALGVLALLFGGWAVYRLAGGDKDDVERKANQQASVEPETRENQGNVWCELRELPHMRETLDGELLNLATGDRIYWIKHRDEKCIEIKLTGKTVITGTR